MSEEAGYQEHVPDFAGYEQSQMKILQAAIDRWAQGGATLSADELDVLRQAMHRQPIEILPPTTQTEIAELMTTQVKATEDVQRLVLAARVVGNLYAIETSSWNELANALVPFKDIKD